MGSSNTRYGFSAVQQGAQDSNGLSHSIMEVTEFIDNYFLGIYISTDTISVPINFDEYPNGATVYIDSTIQSSQNVDICVIDTYTPCATLIRQVKDSTTNAILPLTTIYFDTPTTACRSYRYRLGSVITGGNQNTINATSEMGKLCKLQIGDFKQTAVKQDACCRATQVNFNNINGNEDIEQIYQDFVNLSLQSQFGAQCPMPFSNGFTTNHCKEYMENYCMTNANTQECIMYMISELLQDQATLDTFINYCSQNLNDRVCLYMAIVARRHGQSAIPDIALKNYCTNNPTDTNCNCYNTINKLPSTFTNNAYIGPIACWYKPCAEETQLQFLLTEQILQRSKCRITLCSIDVGNINLDSSNPSLITLMNDCNTSLNNSINLPQTQPGFFDSPVWKPGSMGILTISIGIILILLPLLLDSL